MFRCSTAHRRIMPSFVDSQLVFVATNSYMALRRFRFNDHATTLNRKTRRRGTATRRTLVRFTEVWPAPSKPIQTNFGTLSHSWTKQLCEINLDRSVGLILGTFEKCLLPFENEVIFNPHYLCHCFNQLNRRMGVNLPSQTFDDNRINQF